MIPDQYHSHSTPTNYTTSAIATCPKKRKRESLEGKSKKICEAMLKRLRYQPLLDPKEIPYNLGEPINLSKKKDLACRQPLSEIATDRFAKNLPYIIALLEGDKKQNGKVTKRVQEIHDGCSLVTRRQSYPNHGMVSRIVPRKITYFINYDQNSEHCYSLGEEKKLRKPKHAAFFDLLIAANNGDYQSQYKLALHYERAEGLGRERSQKEAFRYMKNCAEKPVSDGDLKETHSKAMLQLAHYYYEGKGVEKDLSQAFNWHMKSAMCGNFDAMSFLYLLTAWARSFFTLIPSGKQMPKLSADECGNSGGMKDCGNAIFKRFHYQPLLDPKEKPYNLSASINLSKIEDLVFRLPFSELATDKHEENLPYIIALLEGDHKEKGKITKRVQEIHDGCNLAGWRQSHPKSGVVSWVVPRKITYFINYDQNSEDCYLLGKEKKLRKPKHAAFFDLLIAANNGDYQSQYKLALHYAKAEGLDKERSLKEAFRYMKKCAETSVSDDLKKTHNEVMLKLAHYFSEGIGVEKDLAQAFNWYEKSAKGGNSNGMNNLGCYFENGIGVEKDFAQAFNWYKKSAEAGNSVGMHGLGDCFHVGIGVEKDLAQAFKWYEMSAVAGNSEGMNKLGNCFQYGIGVVKDFAQAFNWYKKSAKYGNSNGMNNLGNCFHVEIGVEEDLAQAFNWYKKSAEAGNSFGMCSLGNCFYVGIGVVKNFAQAFNWYKKGAEGGNADAMASLGYFFEMGIGVEKDLAQAFNWYKKSAESGNSTGMSALGYCFEKGIGVEKDFVQAFVWYKKSAEGGNSASMYNLGHCFQEGMGVEKDFAQAFSWYEKSAGCSNAVGMYNLGKCFEKGVGVEKDLTQAFNWYKKGAEGGNADAMASLGYFFEMGIGVEKKFAQAFNWYKKSAESGNSLGMYNLGTCFEKGIGVAKDFIQAFNWYKKSAMCGNFHSMKALGYCFEKGIGVEKDFVQAFNWYEKSAKNGHAVGMNNLGYCFENGIGVEKDLVQAFNWYKKSAEGGNSIGMSNIGRCFEKGLGVEKDFVQAFNWYMKSAESGNSVGMNRLGYCFYEGTGVEKDFVQSFNWVKKSAEYGNINGMNNLGSCFENGIGVEKDFAQAFSWYKKASECGSNNAITFMAACLLENFEGLQSCEGIPKNKAESEKLAIQWLEKVSKIHYRANYFLGLCRLQGRGVEVNLEQGKQLLLISYKAKPSLETMYSLKSLSESHPELFTAADNPQNYTPLYNDLIKEASSNDLQEFMDTLSLGKRIPRDISEAQRLGSILKEQSQGLAT